VGLEARSEDKSQECSSLASEGAPNVAVWSRTRQRAKVRSATSKVNLIVVPAPQQIVFCARNPRSAIQTVRGWARQPRSGSRHSTRSEAWSGLAIRRPALTA